MADEASLTAEVIPGITFNEGDPITPERLNRLGRPIVELSGTIAGSTVQIGADAIATENIQDGAVTANKLASDVVDEILETTMVTSDQIADGAVITKKLADGAVTGAKIASNTIAGSQILISGNEATLTDSVLTQNPTTSSIRKRLLGNLLAKASQKAPVAGDFLIGVEAEAGGISSVIKVNPAAYTLTVTEVSKLLATGKVSLEFAAKGTSAEIPAVFSVVMRFTHEEAEAGIETGYEFDLSHVTGVAVWYASQPTAEEAGAVHVYVDSPVTVHTISSGVVTLVNFSKWHLVLKILNV